MSRRPRLVVDDEDVTQRAWSPARAPRQAPALGRACLPALRARVQAVASFPERRVA